MTVGELGPLVPHVSFGQIALFVVAIGVWVVGGEFLIKWHHVRRGRTWSYRYSYLSFPFKNFDAMEWSVSILLVLVTLMLNQFAFALGH